MRRHLPAGVDQEIACTIEEQSFSQFIQKVRPIAPSRPSPLMFQARDEFPMIFEEEKSISILRRYTIFILTEWRKTQQQSPETPSQMPVGSKVVVRERVLTVRTGRR